MNRRLVGLVLVLLTAGALVSTARHVPAQAAGQGSVPALPVSAAAELPVCPGPETLQAPQGALPVAAPGPVAVAGVVALPSALGDPGGERDPGDERAGVGSAPAAGLSRLGAGPTEPTAGATGTGPGATAGAPSSRQGVEPAAAASADPPGPAVRLVTAAPAQAGAWRLDVRRGAQVPVVTAGQWTLGTSGDLRGLVTNPCAPAATDSWLVGGGTQPGRRARLLLANPGAQPAVVDVTVFGPQGVVGAPAGQGLAVAPGQQKALYVDALAPGLTSLVLHVVARSGRVAAVLHDSVLRGAVPGGTDDVTPGAPPARRLVIPGLSVAAPLPGPGTAAGALPTDPCAPGAAAVRIADPGGGDAVVRVHLIGPDGEVNLPGGGVVTVTSRSVAEVPVTGVPDGLYAAVVESDTPVVAAAVAGRSRVGGQLAGTPAAARGGAPPSELAWAAAGRPLQATTAVALPAVTGLGRAEPGRPAPAAPVVGVTLALATTGGAGRIVLAEVAADGTVGPARTVAVPARRSVGVPVTAGTAALLIRADDSAAAVVASLVVSTADAAGPLLSVQPVRPGSRTTGAAPVVTEDLRTGLVAVR